MTFAITGPNIPAVGNVDMADPRTLDNLEPDKVVNIPVHNIPVHNIPVEDNRGKDNLGTDN
jgi:hypothetical protein